MIMDASQRKDLVDKMYAPFDLDEHDIRIGSTKNKAQWFVYVRREAINSRLDNLFPLDWSAEIVSVTQHSNYATATMRLTIAGIARENNGSQTGSAENAEKGAVTDAFKRVASMFGLGLYLQSTPRLYTSGGFAEGKRVTDWNKHNQQEKEAFSKFSQWHKQQYGGGKQQGKRNPPVSPQQSAQAPSNGNQSTESKEVSEGRPAVYVTSFTHMCYVSNGQKYLGFANCDPMKNHSDPNMTIIRAYGRTTKVKEWLGDFAYDKLNLDQYTGVTKTTPFIKMALPVEFEYIEETTKTGETFLKATGVVGSDESF